MGPPLNDLSEFRVGISGFVVKGPSVNLFQYGSESDLSRAAQLGKPDPSESLKGNMPTGSNKLSAPFLHLPTQTVGNRK